MAQLRHFQEAINTLNTRVAVIAFATPVQAAKWIEETQSPYKFLLDPQRKSYRAYGLDYSLARSWSPKIFLHYAWLMASGRKWRGIQGDSGQLGGDFIIDRAGIIRMAYRSHDPADRPKVSDILAHLEAIEEP
ncbi:MAG: redoxin domain-containing protein [Chloroflexota bacterium]|nr:MAG: redoxin domain-containing protein [Chloroflexota bacterium]